MLKTTLVVCAFVFSFSATAFAECPGESTAEMLMCLGEEFEAADAELNSSYKIIMNECLAGDKSGQTKLRNAQRAWIKFRDADCEFMAHSMDGGSGENVLRLSCLVDRTEQRVQDFKTELEWCRGR